MKECRYCELIEGKNPKIFEDDKVVVMLDPRPAVNGQVLVMPREHHAILELVPDFIIDELFRIANKVSIAMFDQLQATGINIIVQNGIPAGQDVAHFSAIIIPRKEGDGLSFAWNPKQLSEEEMSTIELSYLEETKSIGQFEREKEKPLELDRKHESKVDESGSGENYKVKHINRIPRW